MQKIATLIIGLCSIFCVQVISAQQGSVISGRIIDTSGNAVINASITLLNAKDSSLIKISLSDSKGDFEFNTVQADSCLLSVTGLGYKSFFSGLLLLNTGSRLIVPAIVLQNADPKILKEVTVVSSKPVIQRQIDRTIINVDALVSSAGSGTLDVLEKSPGVQVDANGTISLNGKQGVIVFINDKPTYLSPADLSNYLRSLPANSVDQIEIMTNPPAKYDASGNAGVINIKIKKTRVKGFNGNLALSLAQGFYPRNTNSFNFNYRINKVNFFGNLSFNTAKYSQLLKIERKFFTNDTLNNIYSQNTVVKRNNTSANARIGMDYYISDNSILGFVVSWYYNPYKETKTNSGSRFNSDLHIDSVILAQNRLTENWVNKSANLNYNYKHKGKELSINLDHLRYNLKSDEKLTTDVFFPDNSLKSTEILTGNLPALMSIYTAKLDYTHNLGNVGTADAGLKTSFIKTDNTAEFYNYENNNRVINNDLTNYFLYRENVNAAYVNYNKEFKKLTLQAGLRLEHTDIKGHQLGNKIKPDSLFERNYTNLFPTFYALYKLDSTNTHQLGLSYGRRINRPNYQDMNPFIWPVDKFTFYSGNPFLLPTFSHNIEFSHTFKNKLTTTLQYSNIKNIISETVEQSNGLFIVKPGNIGKNIVWGLIVNADIKPAKLKWYTSQLYAGFTINEFKGILYNQLLDNKAGSLLVSANNQFLINKLWRAELFAGYQTRKINAQLISEPIWVVNAGVQRKVLKTKGSVRLNFKDIFASVRPRGTITTLANSSGVYNNKIDNRAIILSFTYNFNSGKSLKERQTGGSDTEQRRIKKN